MKYTPRLEVILKELNLSIPSFRIIYCTQLVSLCTVFAWTTFVLHIDQGVYCTANSLHGILYRAYFMVNSLHCTLYRRTVLYKHCTQLASPCTVFVCTNLYCFVAKPKQTQGPDYTIHWTVVGVLYRVQFALYTLVGVLYSETIALCSIHWTL